MKLYNDSKSAISIVHKPIQHDQMKQVRIDRNFIKHEIDFRVVNLSYVSTKNQETYILTKALPKPRFEFLVGKLGMINIYSPA